MDIEIFSLCDFAEDFNGKLCVIGTFGNIAVNRFPALHPHCFIAARIRFDRAEAGIHPFRITIASSDGNDLVPPLRGQITAQPAESESHATVNLALSTGQMLFQKPGVYSIELTLGGKAVKSLPVTVEEKRQ
jgi:hypothetical protein